MPGAALIEQVEPDRSAKEAAGGILELLAGDNQSQPWFRKPCLKSSGGGRGGQGDEAAYLGLEEEDFQRKS